MRRLLMASVALAAAGCFGLEEALQTERDPVSPPGIAPVEDMTGGAVPQAAPGQDAAAAPAPRQPFIGRTTARVVDRRQALAENPNLVEVENRVTGNDPLTVAASAYVSATSRASVANFEHQLRIMRELNEGRYPTYEEYMNVANQMRIEFAMLPPYQMYAYDSDTGGVVILEDPEDKARRRREAGIPLD